MLRKSYLLGTYLSVSKLQARSEFVGQFLKDPTMDIVTIHIYREVNASFELLLRQFLCPFRLPPQMNFQALKQWLMSLLEQSTPPDNNDPQVNEDYALPFSGGVVQTKSDNPLQARVPIDSEVLYQELIRMTESSRICKIISSAILRSKARVLLGRVSIAPVYNYLWAVSEGFTESPDLDSNSGMGPERSSAGGMALDLDLKTREEYRTDGTAGSPCRRSGKVTGGRWDPRDPITRSLMAHS
ncbi:hypothetical protein BX600DRAFT_525757 [Xylariales sp. PMI_506]|nr:hypothetical protein BX600DRAFT_525757 [Xylariales sp. PMI_506]